MLFDRDVSRSQSQSRTCFDVVVTLLGLALARVVPIYKEWGSVQPVRKRDFLPNPSAILHGGIIQHCLESHSSVVLTMSNWLQVDHDYAHRSVLKQIDGALRTLTQVASRQELSDTTRNQRSREGFFAPRQRDRDPWAAYGCLYSGRFSIRWTLCNCC